MKAMSEIHIRALGKDKAEVKYRCNALLKHSMFKTWQAKHGAALRKRVDINKLFTELGFCVKLSPKSSREIYDMGSETMPS